MKIVKTINYSLLLCAVFLTTTQFVLAQGTGSIAGQVLDSTHRTPIEYSSVALFLAGDNALVNGVISDERGNFELKNLSLGRYDIEIRFLGYQTRKVTGIEITHDKRQINLGEILLPLNTELLGEVEVRGARSTVQHTLDKQVYRAEQFQSAVGGSSLDLLRNMPSVSVNNEGEILVRGTSGFMVLVDGRPVMGDAATFLSQLPANVISEIEMVTSPSARHDPDGKAGIVNIITKKGSSDGVYLLVNAQLGAPSIETFGNEKVARRFGGDITTNIRRGKWDIALGVDYKRNDNTGYRDGEVTTTLNGIHTSLPSLGERSYRREAYSGRTSLTFTPNEAHKVSASLYAGRRTEWRTADILYRQTRTLIGETNPFERRDYYNMNMRERRGDFFIAALDYQHKFKNKGDLTTSFLFEHTELGGPTDNVNVNPENHRDTLDRQLMEEYNPLNGLRWNVDYRLPLKNNFTWETGYQFRHLVHVGEFAFKDKILNTADFVLRPEYGGDIDLTRNIHSVYSQIAKKGDRFSYNAGLRLEHTDRTLEEASGKTYHFNRWSLFPSVSALYAVNDDLQFKGSYNRRIERTTTNMMNPFMARRHSEVLEEGDPELLPELIDAVEIGVIKSMKQHSVFANLYYRHTANSINRVNSVHNDSTLYRTFTNAAASQAYGLEAGVELKPSQAWRIYAGGNVYQYAVKGNIFGQNLSRNSVNYSINFNTNVDLSKTWSAQFSLNYLSKTVTVQGEDTQFYSPDLSLRKTILKNRGALTLQWLNIGAGVFKSNRQRKTTWGSDFYSSTDYISETDRVMLNFTYRLNDLGKVLKFSKSEFGDKEF